jgi:formiminoglutamase/agmatinase
MTSGVAFVGAPYDGAATLGWPGARYAPDEVRRHLAWMRMRVQDGRIYWVDQDRIVPWRPEQLIDSGDAAIVPHDIVATHAAIRAKTREVAAGGLVPAVVGGDDSILFPAVAGVHDAVTGSVGIVHLDAHLDLLDESPAQGRFSQSSGMRRALELPRVSARHSVQVGTRSFNFPTSKRFIDEVGLTELPAALTARRGLDWTLARIREVVEGVDHVFLSVDLDVLDPAHAPAGTSRAA